MLSKQHELFIIHQKGHADNDTRLLTVAKYFFPMLLKNEKYRDDRQREDLLRHRGPVCPRTSVHRAAPVSGGSIHRPTPGMLQPKAPNHKPLLPSSGTEFGLKSPS